jgi:His/Glu/Gln/Arg/opine family amino acid ABC transporter permease subunit
MIVRAPRSRACRHATRVQERCWKLAVTAALLGMIWLARDFGWDVVWNSRAFLLKGLAMSWALALISTGVGLMAAIPLAAARTYGPVGIRHVAAATIELVRATPELMVIFWAFFAVPLLTGSAVSSWLAAIVALASIATVYLAEVIRGGLSSVSRQQWEAALASGLSEFQAFLHVVLPQALRNMVPALLAQLVMLFKATSLVAIIGVVEFFRAVSIVNNASVAPYALYTLLAVVYFVCCWLLTSIVRWLDPKYVVSE